MSENRNKGKPKTTPATVLPPELPVNLGGRPRRWETPEELIADLEKYFATCGEGRPPTVSDILVRVGVPESTWYDYRDRPGYSEVIKKAELAILAAQERKLLTDKTNQGGRIFWFKNRYGWKDTQTIENTEDRRDEKELMASFTALIHQLAPILVSNQQPPIKVIEATSTPRNDTETILNLDDYRKE